MNLAKLSDAQYGLLFDVRRSIRYHDRRRAFFELLHRVTSVLTILLAGSVLFELAGTGSPAVWLQVAGAIAAVLAAMDMVVGYAAFANRHAGLRGRFADLEVRLLSGDLSDAAWEAHQRDRLLIERDEPPVYRALDLLCRNEQMSAEGIGAGLSRLSAFQRLSCQILQWPNIATTR